MTLDPAVTNTTDRDSAITAQTPPAVQPVSVWATAQNAPTAQRRGRYHPDSTAHPAKMFPAIVAHAVDTYTQPGDLVVDPMCGIGTTLVESLHLGRRAVGVEYESRWAELARTNIGLAREAGIDLDANVYTGDARKLGDLIPAELRGQASLVITSPPYGDSLHGHVRANRTQPVLKSNHRYGQVLDRGNLANVGLGRLLSGFTKILAGAAEYLAPAGQLWPATSGCAATEPAPEVQRAPATVAATATVVVSSRLVMAARPPRPHRTPRPPCRPLARPARQLAHRPPVRPQPHRPPPPARYRPRRR
ncbi:TRM11 family SAM-dependent methyltransferase [Nocardia rhizosphaerihabitans]|uniref:TRM11 family SAM-dependent methyltransferase n=1 Tax=Nocardia rhizosphaerihabitans TaxID=1691570 RepID=UPI00366D361D